MANIHSFLSNLLLSLQMHLLIFFFTCCFLTFAPLPTVARSHYDPKSYCKVPPHTDQQELDIPSDICSNPSSPLQASQKLGFDPTLSHEVARNISHKYAPLTYFHPRENSFIANGAEWIRQFGSNATFQVKEDQYYRYWRETMTEELLFQSARIPNMSMSASDYFWVMNNDSDSNAWRQGAGFDENQQSKGVSYFNVYDFNDEVWVINYWFWYPYQGCSNQWAVSWPSGLNHSIGVLFEVCDYGVHDGDLENLAVVVCKNSEASAMPIMVRYMQHDLPTTYRNCSRNECKFVVTGTEKGLESEPYHPISYTALFSHALYDEAVVNYVYDVVPIPWARTVLGLMLTDRTYDGDNTTKRYVPTHENCIFLPNIDLLNVSHYPDAFWTGFGGRYGQSDGTIRGINEIICVDNITGLEVIPCPTDQIFFNMVLNMYGLNASGTPNQNSSSNKEYWEIETADPAPQGPYNRIFWNEWVSADVAPIYVVMEQLNLTSYDVEHKLCYDYLGIPGGDGNNNTYVPTSEWVATSTWNYLANIAGAIIFAIVLFLVTLVMFGWATFLNVFQMLPSKDKSKKETRLVRIKTVINISGYTSVVITNIVGFALFISSCDTFFRLLEKYINITSWKTVLIIIYLFTVVGFFLYFICLAIQLVFLVHIFKFKLRHLERIHVSEIVASISDRKKAFYRWVTAVMVLFSMIYLVLYFLSFLSAIGIVSIYQVFVPACNAVGEVVEGVCLSLNMFGGLPFICGPAIAEFCADWQSFKVNYTFWGAVLVFVTAIIGFLVTSGVYWHVRYFMDPESNVKGLGSGSIVTVNGDIEENKSVLG